MGSLDIFLAGISQGLILSLLIGPSFFLLIETSISKGFRAALAVEIGIISSDALCILISYFGSKDILYLIKDKPGLHLIGGAVFIIYGLSSIFLKEKKNNRKKIQIGMGFQYLTMFFKGFLMNLLNIGVLFFWLTITVVMVPNLDFDPKKIIMFFAISILVYFLIDLIKITLAKQFRKKMTNKVIAQFKKIISIIIIGFGIVLIVKALT